jgi:hypothetical protein
MAAAAIGRKAIGPLSRLKNCREEKMIPAWRELPVRAQATKETTSQLRL